MHKLLKIFLLIVVLLCSFLAGQVITKHFYTRQKFYSSLCTFCENLNLKISYSKSKLEDIVKSQMERESGEFVKLLGKYLAFIKNEESKEEFMNYKIRFLSNSERELVLDFFASLGEMAKEEEIEKISYHKKAFDKTSEECTESTKKFSSLYFKLCMVFGLFLVVIFI